MAANTTGKQAGPANAQTMTSSRFHLDLWITLCLVNWICDFGRPIAALFLPLDIFPLRYPSAGDYLHFVYNALVPFCLLKFIERSSSKKASTLQILCVILFSIGSSIHLVGDSINHRLIHLGYQNHLTVEGNPLIQNISSCLSLHNSNGKLVVEVFELLYFYDEYLGHNMWYIPLFTAFITFFFSSFTSRDQSTPTPLPLGGCLLLPLDALYYVYLVTEGQIIVIFGVMLVVMIGGVVVGHFIGQHPDVNARYLLSLYIATALLTGAWSLYFWNHTLLRQRYPGPLYVPEPWSVYSLWRLGQL